MKRPSTKRNPKRRVVRVSGEDHRDFSERMPMRKPRYAGQSGPQRYAKIRYDVTYEIITPESAEEGDVAERGYEHKGLTADSVTDMVRTLRNDGATEASSSHWHKGLWYTAYGEMDYRDGSTTNRSFHIRAPEAVQRLIARAMGVKGASGRTNGRKAPKRRTVRRAPKAHRTVRRNPTDLNIELGRALRLTSGGYGPGKYGQYFGRVAGTSVYPYSVEGISNYGSPFYKDGHVCASSRAEAIKALKARYPGATVSR